MKIFVTTIAGKASRFNKDLNFPVSKSIYFEESPKETILYNLLSLAQDYDQVIIVCGYLYEDLMEYSRNHLTGRKNIFVYNPHFESLGSAYSLYVGLKEAQKCKPDEIVFAEGDLFFSRDSFKELEKTKKSAITINDDLIEAGRSVVAYVNEKRQINYIYDTSHKYLAINEPFISIFNSGQVWKFMDVELLNYVINDMDEKRLSGTNLEIISDYFKEETIDRYAVVRLENWLNCNTVYDYHLFLDYLRGHK